MPNTPALVTLLALAAGCATLSQVDDAVVDVSAVESQLAATQSE